MRLQANFLLKDAAGLLRDRNEIAGRQQQQAARMCLGQRRPKPTPLRTHAPFGALLHRLFRAGASLGVPDAASLLAVGLGLCGVHISCEGWAGEGKC
jgi:hypothetical protein